MGEMLLPISSVSNVLSRGLGLPKQASHRYAAPVTSDENGDLARLCAHLPRLRRAAAGELRDELDRVVEVARSGGDVGGTLADLLVRLDVPDIPATVREVTHLPGVQWTPSTDVYVCPRGVCSRWWARRPGVPIPRCELLSGTLVQEPA